MTSLWTAIRTGCFPNTGQTSLEKYEENSHEWPVQLDLTLCRLVVRRMGYLQVLGVPILEVTCLEDVTVNSASSTTHSDLKMYRKLNFVVMSQRWTSGSVTWKRL